MAFTVRLDIPPASRTVAMLALHGLLTVAGIAVAKAARDAICVSVYTPRQIASVEAVAVAATALTIGAQLHVLKHVSLRSFLRLAPLVFALGDLGLWAGFDAAPLPLVGAVAYLWVSLQASLLTPLVPVLAASSLSIAEAARLCGLVGAGTTIGWMGGGVLTATLAARGGVPSLLLAAAGLTAASIAAVVLLPPGGRPAPAANPISVPGLWRRAKTICDSPHLRPLALLALVSSAVTTIVGLQFKLIASGPMRSAAELAGFFGHLTLITGCVALLIQLLATARVVRMFDLRVALLVTPLVLALGAVGTLATGSLLAVVFLRGSDQVFRYTIDRAGLDLLYRPLPADQMLEHRPFIDAVVSRLGDAMGSLLVLGTIVRAGHPLTWLSVLALALLVAWGVFAWIARRSYGEELRSLLRLPPSIGVRRPRWLRPWLAAV